MKQIVLASLPSFLGGGGRRWSLGELATALPYSNISMPYSGHAACLYSSSTTDTTLASPGAGPYFSIDTRSIRLSHEFPRDDPAPPTNLDFERARRLLDCLPLGGGPDGAKPHRTPAADDKRPMCHHLARGSFSTSRHQASDLSCGPSVDCGTQSLPAASGLDQFIPLRPCGAHASNRVYSLSPVARVLRINFLRVRFEPDRRSLRLLVINPK